MRQIRGMTIIITGASAGIGAALARELHRQGARVVLAARRRERLEALAKELPGSLVVEADVADPAACQRLITAVPGRIDAVVCNAGYGLLKNVVDTTPDEWLAILRTNLLGTTECIRAALPRLHEQEQRDGWRGQIIIVSSALARRSKPAGAAYSATKAAQLSVAESLRIELAPARIAVTSVHPIQTATEFSDASHGDRSLSRSFGGSQTAELVALRIAKAIARPVPEVWPHRASRWGLSFATLFPGLIDRFISKRWARAER